MNIYIDHEDTLDVRDIAVHIRNAGDVLEDEKATEDERTEAAEALKVYEDAYTDLTGSAPHEGWEALADAWEDLGNTGDPVLIRETYFTEYIEDLIKDIGGIPREVPEYIEIDWEKTAENLSVDYTEFRLDGVDYLNRLG